ncbi:TetR/AcrR family transcriptional regulator [Sediminitomix flava]|uniref:TetR family transcriptional regulator n=1 Tax=Sediminitomix flava TaxID=379075 RepID=A0A316A4C5_SEDFL|nr:TetR/AcrR family transcriptional regulator [Sediminitomix flava]PWJ44587.1 TetR family transcriptional regulator [Sediminitomix flava]
MPKTKEQFEEIREQSRKLILDTAASLFAEKGYLNTSISTIAKEAGIAKGSLYHYFKSKEELLNELLIYAIGKEKEIFDKVEPMGLPAFERLEQLCKEFSEVVMENTREWRIYFNFSLQADASFFKEEHVVAHLGRVQMTFYQIFEELGVEDPLLETSSFVAQMFGAFAMFLYSPNEEFQLQRVLMHYINRYRT